MPNIVLPLLLASDAGYNVFHGDLYSGPSSIFNISELYCFMLEEY